LEKITIVIPDSQFDCHAQLRSVTGKLQICEDFKIIFVDRQKIATRAGRLNFGFAVAKSDWILFHHPRSWLNFNDYIDLVKNLPNKPCWMGFQHSFDVDSRFLKFTSWYSNNIRFKRGIVYLDHCVLFHRSLMTAPIPNVSIFEDTELSKILLKSGKPILLNKVVKTSAIRFLKNGYFKQGFLNQVLKLAYYLNLPHSFMNSIYEKGLGLNDKK
jgi:hypothetical protein